MSGSIEPASSASPRSRRWNSPGSSRISTAVILAGGAGTRLRPLTDATPKPMLPLLGKPFLMFLLEWLRDQGVERVTVACGGAHEEAFAALEKANGISVSFHLEAEPLGTGGAVRAAAAELDERFLVVNGDSIRMVDLERFAAFHAQSDAATTILLAREADATRYGLVDIDPDGRVVEFVEKPHAAMGGLINAGTYLLEPQVVATIPGGRMVSLEHEIFPRLVADRTLFAIDLPGRGFDIGTPVTYLASHLALLADRGVEVHPTAAVDPAAELLPPVVIDSEAVVEAASVGPLAYVGSGARIGARARVIRTAVIRGSEVSPGAQLADAIVAPEGVVQA